MKSLRSRSAQETNRAASDYQTPVASIPLRTYRENATARTITLQECGMQFIEPRRTPQVGVAARIFGCPRANGPPSIVSRHFADDIIRRYRARERGRMPRQD